MNHNRKIIYIAGFLFSIPIALTSYINSSFLASLAGESSVGIIYALGSIASILALLLAPNMWRVLGGYKFLIFTSILNILSLLAITLVKSPISAGIVFVAYFAINTLIISSLDELLKIFSKDRSTGKIRGIYLTSCNLAWILAQLASGTILGEYPFRSIYLISFIITIIFLLVSLFAFRHMPDPDYDKTKILKYIKEFIKNKNLFRAYSMNYLLQFFYSWMVIYTPIYLATYLGFSWKEIGVIFSIMLIPFSLIPIPLGKYADKIGERKILMFGFVVTSLGTVALFFANSHNIFIWALLLFITRIGAASVETMSDVYFFKHIKPENEQYVGVYRSASPVAYIAGPLLAFFALTFIPSFNFLYVILGALMLSGVYISSTINKSDI